MVTMIFIVTMLSVKENCVEKANATVCPIGLSQEEVGDKWTMLILRELFLGVLRYDGIQLQTGATTQMLSTRLKKMEEDGLVERRLYSEKPKRYEYHLTAKGRELFPVFLAYRAWAEKWCKPAHSEPAVSFIHKLCGEDTGCGVVCQNCGKALREEDLIGTMSPSYQHERNLRSTPNLH